MKPLTDTMERSLVVIVDKARDDHAAGRERQWHKAPFLQDETLDLRGITLGTVSALETRGLIETDASDMRWCLVRATDRGVQLCNSMGD